MKEIGHLIADWVTPVCALAIIGYLQSQGDATTADFILAVFLFSLYGQVLQIKGVQNG